MRISTALSVFLAVLIVVLVGPSATPHVAADQIDVSCTKDNTLYQGTTPLSNGGGTHMFAGRTGQSSLGVRRALIFFDVAEALPANATIESVELQLYLSSTSSFSNQTIRIHRVTAEWGESVSFGTGGQGGGAPAFVGDATWMFRIYDQQPWTTPGGDFVAAVSGAQTIGTNGFYTWSSTPGLVSDVQDWYEHPDLNHGWILLGNETSAQTAKRFDTREEGIVARRPRLRINFSTPPEYLPGDCNVDGSFNIADVIQLLSTMFPSAGGGSPAAATCLDACDGNDDGALHVSDAVTMLSILFNPTPQPQPVCGQDRTLEDGLECAAYGFCP